MGNTKRNYIKPAKDKREFVRDLYPVAVETAARLKEKGYGISVMAILAMAALESNWGEEMRGNMYFEKRADTSIPAEGKQLLLRRRLHNTHMYNGYTKVEKILPLADGQYKYIVKEWYRKYDTPLQNFIHHFMDLVNDTRYYEAVALGVSGKLFLEKLGEAGYTYNKKYGVEERYASKAIYAMQMIDRNLDISITNPNSKIRQYPLTHSESYQSSS